LCSEFPINSVESDDEDVVRMKFFPSIFEKEGIGTPRSRYFYLGRSAAV
jgi:hypothetical protein